jgi:hypothetical protein
MLNSSTTNRISKTMNSNIVSTKILIKLIIIKKIHDLCFKHFEIHIDICQIPIIFYRCSTWQHPRLQIMGPCLKIWIRRVLNPPTHWLTRDQNNTNISIIQVIANCTFWIFVVTRDIICPMLHIFDGSKPSCN